MSLSCGTLSNGRPALTMRSTLASPQPTTLETYLISFKAPTAACGFPPECKCYERWAVWCSLSTLSVYSSSGLFLSPHNPLKAGEGRRVKGIMSVCGLPGTFSTFKSIHNMPGIPGMCCSVLRAPYLCSTLTIGGISFHHSSPQTAER